MRKEVRSRRIVSALLFFTTFSKREGSSLVPLALLGASGHLIPSPHRLQVAMPGPEKVVRCEIQFSCDQAASQLLSLSFF